MTTTTDFIAADPHHLGETSEPLADEPELRARLEVSSTWLRRLRRQRRVRYIDRRPDLRPGKGAGERYLYAVVDVERERARVEAAKAAAAPPPRAVPPQPRPSPPTPIPRPLPPAARATLRGRAPTPEVYVRRARP